MDDAYRAGLNRGSADKLAGRHSDDAVPPKHRTSDVDRRAYKKGYKHGYTRTKAPAQKTGAEREYAMSEGLLRNGLVYEINDLIRSGVGGDVFVSKIKPSYDKMATDADDLSRKYGSFDSKVLRQEMGTIVYGKAIELGASPAALASISYMATPEQLAATPKPAASQPAPKTSITMIRPGAFQYFRIDPQKVATKQPSASTVSDSPAPQPAPTQSMPQRPVMTTTETMTLQPMATAQPMSLPTPPAAFAPMALSEPAKTAAPGSQAQPSWFANNWYWLVGGAAVVAGGGYMIYTRNRRQP